ncbi:lytic transglycosylase domain-containing protein [Phenylobacterium sp. LjRoot225]|uniref:lytic transglycosylase domain-containing protein n=1 Tax=Phenylobacterium sp. LjRoot225 TaxID=3342285 RepID=UPI003ECF1A28
MDLVKPLLAGVLALALPAAARAEEPWAAEVRQAAGRVGLPEPLIHAVLRAESGGDPRAVSRAGAMGLMQLMPATWADLRRELGLGADPFQPADNLQAGAAYLRRLYDRYGLPGALAAYNAGPSRFEAYLNGRPLPPETRRYVAGLAASTASVASPAGRFQSIPPQGLFAVRYDTRAAEVPPAAPSDRGLFVSRP